MVIQWIIIVVLIFVGFYYLKMEHHAQKLKIVILIILAAIIYFSMMNIFTSETIDLTSPRGVVSAVYVYFGWIGETASELWDIGVDTTHLVGNAIKVNKDENNRDKERR